MSTHDPTSQTIEITHIPPRSPDWSANVQALTEAARTLEAASSACTVTPTQIETAAEIVASVLEVAPCLDGRISASSLVLIAARRIPSTEPASSRSATVTITDLPKRGPHGMANALAWPHEGKTVAAHKLSEEPTLPEYMRAAEAVAEILTTREITAHHLVSLIADAVHRGACSTTSHE